MNAQLAHTTASNTVSMPMEDFYVDATLATSSTLMELLADPDPIIYHLHVIMVLHKAIWP